MENDGPRLPIPISAIEDRYLIFDIQAISWLRKHHNICGVFVGTLPQNPSQNVFLGLPMEIMPEEAQLLIELGIGYILDDAKAHDTVMAKSKAEYREHYVAEVHSQASGIAGAKAREKEVLTKKALKKAKVKHSRRSQDKSAESQANDADDDAASEALFTRSPSTELVTTSTRSASSMPQNQAAATSATTHITPSTSTLLLPHSNLPDVFSSTRLPSLLPGLTSASYSLYKHLHSSPRNFFMTPGLRFGCQFCVYPGDPLRFHSHFLAVGVEWDEELDLMDIVGGGRLGTGVKKGYLIGGREEGRSGDGDGEARMRCFSVEWAGM